MRPLGCPGSLHFRWAEYAPVKVHSMWDCYSDSIQEHFSHTSFNVTRWTHRWVWQQEGPYPVVLPARSELTPIGLKLSLWSCGHEPCTGSSWRVAGQGLHQKIRAAHWTRWKPAAPPLFLVDAYDRISIWFSHSYLFIPYSPDKKKNHV